MATLNLGRIKPVFRGAYAGGTAYVVDDIVTSGNETFICILASTGNATSNATYWTKLAAKGTDGTDVGTTITTEGDILYRDGSGLQRLAKGTASQQLRMNSGATAPEWATITSGALIKSYYKIFKGGQSISGGGATPAIVSNYNLTVTPQSASSVFLVTWTLAIGSSSDHTFIQARAKSGSGSYENIGLGKSSLAGDHFNDFGSFYVGGDANNLKVATNQFYYAPASTDAQEFALYYGQHSGTAYWGRSSANTGTDDYSAGTAIRVDEFNSTSELVGTEYTSG